MLHKLRKVWKLQRKIRKTLSKKQMDQFNNAKSCDEDTSTQNGNESRKGSVEFSTISHLVLHPPPALLLTDEDDSSNEQRFSIR